MERPLPRSSLYSPRSSPPASWTRTTQTCSRRRTACRRPRPGRRSAAAAPPRRTAGSSWTHRPAHTEEVGRGRVSGRQGRRSGGGWRRRPSKSGGGCEGVARGVHGNELWQREKAQKQGKPRQTIMSTCAYSARQRAHRKTLLVGGRGKEWEGTRSGEQDFAGATRGATAAHIGLFSQGGPVEERGQGAARIEGCPRVGLQEKWGAVPEMPKFTAPCRYRRAGASGCRPATSTPAILYWRGVHFH